MLELYHAPLSSCSQKVRLVLAEKHLDWKGHLVDLLKGEQHEPEYRRLNPAGVVPTLVDGGRALVESTAINEYLEDAYPETALRPEAPADRHAMRLWTKYFDEAVHPACSVLTYAVGIRPMLLRRPPAEVHALIDAIPNRTRREQRRSVYEEGLESSHFDPAIATHLALLDRMSERLSNAEWLAGDRFSLADAAALPYVLRLDHLAMSDLWGEGRRSAVANWLARVQGRPSYAAAVEALAPPEAVAGMRSGGEVVWPQIVERLGDELGG